MLHNSVGVQVLTKPIPNMQNIQDVSVTLVTRLPSKMKTRASLAEKKTKIEVTQDSVAFPLNSDY